jgi:prepilin-type N-terminal cleavage/methylation domain-containing protein
MIKKLRSESGFTLLEVAIVLLVVSILLGYTVAMFPVQQEFKQYRAVNDEMDRIIDAIYAYAQVNGRLPCAASLALRNGSPDAEDGNASPDNGTECNQWYGYLPAKTLGIDGRYDVDKLLLDPWGNPYRYQVTANDTGAGAGPEELGVAGGDFIMPNDIKNVSMANLDPDLEICTAVANPTPTNCGPATVTVAEGIPAVVLSLGKNGATAPAESNIQLENTDNSATDTVFIRSTISDVESAEFDDIVKWVAPNTLYSKMIDAGQLPN